MKGRNEFDNIFDWLYYLQNNLGEYDLQIQGNFIKDGELLYTKRKYVLDILFDESEKSKYFVKNAAHRTILAHEIVLDIDELHPKFKSLKEQALFYHNKLKQYSDIKYYTYFTGSKSYHIHIFIPMLKLFNNERERDYLKLNLIKLLGCDTLKVGKNMIAIEGQKHYKSGLIKEEVFI